MLPPIDDAENRKVTEVHQAAPKLLNKILPPTFGDALMA
jgi:hypothetical protein